MRPDALPARGSTGTLDADARQGYACVTMPPSEPPPVEDKRESERLGVDWTVDCETEDTFLFAAITNVSQMGIFVRTDDPLPVGTVVSLRFAPPSEEAPFALQGRVQWINRVSLFGENINPRLRLETLHLSRYTLRAETLPMFTVSSKLISDQYLPMAAAA